MSEFAQRTVPGAASHRAAKKRRRREAQDAPSRAAGAVPGAGRDGAVEVGGRTLYRVTTADGREVLVGSRLRREILEQAARLASGD
ncbi:hypothetical protein AS188_12465 [Kocuria flava]|uniref:Uncharacterized protein n=1 Tax=Kocuria flava TaxID=446860 RepID=A0A0U2WVQ8_9MICC|nr:MULTISPECIES: hypothetical protein [Kocuria]ALU40436.1 hypothetical protein AS188_12465 [Kocuria flava]MCD1145625.1 hypothetical protein [Kocuria sp. LUK]MCJ8505008.1 hypothetical protein [Kocuria flava]GEO92709.1 hypothetical protein KFL01_20150 [Kocuria flava]